MPGGLSPAILCTHIIDSFAAQVKMNCCGTNLLIGADDGARNHGFSHAA
jgi:hypothetical protein